MSLATLINQKPIRTRFKGFKGPVGIVDLLIVDVTISETPTYENEVTENPVEQGLDVNDHIRVKPVTIQLEGFISEAPLTLSDDVNSASTSAAGESLGGFATSAGAVAGKALGGGYASTVAAVAGGQLGAQLFKTAKNPAELAREALEQMLINKIVFSLVTKRRSYDNMVLLSLTFPRDVSNGQGLRFSAKVREINIVQTADVLITNIKRDAAAGAAKKDKGNQTAKPAEEKRTSVLRKTGSFLGSKAGAFLGLN